MDLFNVGSAQVRKSMARDIQTISDNIRESDREELWSVAHLMPYEAIKTSFENSKLCWTVTRFGKSVAIFGVGEPNTVWMIATKDFSKLNQKFLKRSRSFIGLMLAEYPKLENCVSLRNEASIKWLLFCGAKFGEVVQYGKDKIPFQKFTFERKHVS